MKRLLLGAALCLPLPAAATGTGTLTAEYTGLSHGLTVLKLAGSLTLTPTGYAAHVTFHTAGLIGFVVHYVDGNPVVHVLSPPVEQERTPIPPAQTKHTIDTLSALALLIRQVGETGTCSGTVTTFDGRRLATQTAHAVGEEDLPKTGPSIFAGKALHCDLEGRQLGGFVRNEDEDSLRKPRHGSAWLAEVVPGAPPVPVKVIFENKILGRVTLYLTAVTGGPGTAVAQCCAAGQTQP
jgi:hypothetical protein